HDPPTRGLPLSSPHVFCHQVSVERGVEVMDRFGIVRARDVDFHSTEPWQVHVGHVLDTSRTDLDMEFSTRSARRQLMNVGHCLVNVVGQVLDPCESVVSRGVVGVFEPIENVCVVRPGFLMCCCQQRAHVFHSRSQQLPCLAYV